MMNISDRGDTFGGTLKKKSFCLATELAEGVVYDRTGRPQSARWKKRRSLCCGDGPVGGRSREGSQPRTGKRIGYVDNTGVRADRSVGIAVARSFGPIRSPFPFQSLHRGPAASVQAKRPF